jgi:hypothetical protein
MFNNNKDAMSDSSAFGTWIDVNYTYVTPSYVDAQESSMRPIQNANYVMVRVRLKSFTDTSKLNFYIDNVTATVPAVWPGEDVVGFEQAGQVNFVYNDKDHLESKDAGDRGVNVSRVAYADEGIPAPANGGSYGVKMLALTAYPTSFVQFQIDIGRPIQPGMTVSFDFYMKSPTALKDIYKVRYNNNKESGTQGTTINQWLHVSFTYEAYSSTRVNENLHTPNTIQFRIRMYDTDIDKTTISIYIDNFQVLDA